MLDLDSLKRKKEMVRQIDWDMTPQEAFEAYQIKSPGSWKSRSLEDVLYFFISVWQGEAKLILTRRTYKDSETMAEIQAPPDLMALCLEEHGGAATPTGQYPLCDELKAWLRKALAD